MTGASAPTAVVVGHACLDIIPEMPLGAGVTPGRLVEIGAATITTGGAAFNTGIALHKLGVRTRVVGAMGRDPFAQIVQELLAAHGAEVHFVVFDEAPTSYTLVISPVGVDRSFLHCPGVNHLLSPNQVSNDLFQGARVLHFGYPPVMRETYLDGGHALANMFARARSHGLITSLDTCDFVPGSPAADCDWPAFFQHVLPAVDCFTPSYDELARAIGEDPDVLPNHQMLERIGAQFLEYGAAVVLIKLGEDGLFAAVSPCSEKLKRLGKAVQDSAGQSYRQPCFAVDVAGTTGAGDAAIAGFLAGLLEGEPIPAALQMAAAVGACCVEKIDASSGICSLPEIRRRMDAGWSKLPCRMETS